MYARTTDSYVEISVEDNGRGISAEDVAQIIGEKVYDSRVIGMKNATGMEETVDAYTYRMLANERARNDQAAPEYTDDILELYRTGAKGYTDNNWIDMFMNKLAFQQSHTVSVRGGTDKVKYYVSFGYNGDNGLLKSGIQYYHRYNLRSNLTAELTKG